MLALCLLFISLLLNAYKGAKYLSNIKSEGAGYTSKWWVENEGFFSDIKNLFGNEKIYCSNPDVLYMTVEKPSYDLPLKNFHTQDKDNTTYFNEMEALKNDMKNGAAIVYVYTGSEYITSIPTEDELKAFIPLKIVQSSKYGNVLIYYE